MKLEFTKEDTKVIKGFCILLMITHHIWGFPERTGISFHTLTIFAQDATTYIAFFSKICVSIYSFIGGYGIYKAISKNKRTIFEQIKKMYISFWKIFLIFIPIAFAFFGSQVQHINDDFMVPRYNLFIYEEAFRNFFGISTSYNSEWWYVLFYVVALLTTPLFIKIFEKHSSVENIFLVVILSIVLENVTPQLGALEIFNLNSNSIYRFLFSNYSLYFCCFLLGVLFSKDDLLSKLNKELRNNIKLNTITDIIIIFVITGIRKNLSQSMDLLYTPIIVVVALDLLTRNKIVESIFKKLGENSTNMWLIHTFFCYYFFSIAKTIILPEYPILSLIILVVLSFLTSILVDYFWKNLSKIIKRILMLTTNKN